MNLALRSFALSMVGIFIPIYLLTLGYSFNLMLIFFLAFFLALGVASLPVVAIGRRIGLKHLILLSMPLHVLFILMLVLLDGANLSMLIATGVITGVANAFYWVPLHALFATYTNKEHVTEKASYIFSLHGAASIVGPLLGGVIIFFSGFKVLLGITSIIFFVSTIPLFYTKDIKVKYFRWSNVLVKNHQRCFWGYFIYGAIHMTGTVLWPVFVFVLLSDVILLGTSGTFSAVGIVAFPFVLRALHKKFSLQTLFKLGGLFGFLVLSLLPVVSGKYSIYVASFLVGGVIILTEMPFYTLNIIREKKSPLELMMVRELALSAGRVTFILVLLVTLQKLTAGFLITSMLSLIYLVL